MTLQKIQKGMKKSSNFKIKLIDVENDMYSIIFYNYNYCNGRILLTSQK